MKPVIIIAIAFVLLFTPFSAYADVRVSGTTVSGSSDASIVKIVISDSDGKRIWEKSVSVDETFEITMPRLEDGRYTLSMKHGAIGGEQEIVEFTYTGQAPIGSFELEIELPDEPAEDFDSFATKNRISNFERLMDFIRNSEETERRLEVIGIKFDEERGISSQELNEVTRFTPDGLETLEYGIAWTTFRAYNDIIGDARQVLELIENGMSLDTAIDFLGIIPEPEPIPEPTEEMQMGETVEEESELIECETEICVKECNTMPNCTVTWEPEPEPEELQIPAPFVDPTKDPQSYVDRYNNEPTYKKWFDSNFPDYTIHEAVGLPEPAKDKVPVWVKNNAKWWADGEINDDTFVSGIQFLIKEKIVDIPNLPEQASEKARPSFVDESKDPQSYIDRYKNESEYKAWFDENYPDYTIHEAVGVTKPIPGWIKNTASWWSDGLISEDEFIKGIEFLVEKRILNVSEPTIDTNPIQEKIDVKTEGTVFDIKKNEILNNLIQVGHSNSFSILFDTDKSSDGNQFHIYKVVHDKDGWIGDMSFYYGESSPLWHPSKFDDIFQMKIFLSNESGATPTTASKPIIKIILEEFENELSSLGISESSSEWVEASIVSGKDVGGGERKEVLSNDNLEISFASKKTSLGFYELIITENMNED